jgi:FKBP-type peptidyl-prolyl cis-trans isomerase
MQIRHLLFIPLLALAACSASKKTTGTTNTNATDVKVNNPYNMKYKFYKHTPGRQPNTGDIVDFDLSLYTPKDSAVFSTFKQGSHIVMPLEKHKFNGDFMDGIKLMSAGDSADFWVSSDSLIKMNQTAEFIKPGQFLRYDVKLYNLYSPEEYKAKQKSAAGQQDKIDSAKIADYIKTHNLKTQHTADGLYYIIEEPGSGPMAKSGQTVSVHYTGTLLDGKKFDSSLDRGEPISFTLGAGQVIKGWDEGISLLNKGAKAKFLIPSRLAYGSQAVGGGVIPANSVLIFDVQLMDIK